MGVRRQVLPPGWYPGTEDGVRRQIAAWGVEGDGSASPAGVAPHAGWEFSGAVAALVFASLDPDAETVVVVGGHLGRHDRPLAAREEAYAVPGGEIAADLELLAALDARLRLEPDVFRDNTVEVQLPLLRHYFPRARALALRAPPAAASLALGRAVAEAAREVGRRVAVVGSTDLTHYGPNYDFMPRGSGRRALLWVRDDNDARIIRAMTACDAEGTIAAQEEHRAACSAGAAVAAMGFAVALGATEGRLLRYSTSYDVYPGDSIVGYAGIVYPAPRGPSGETA